MDHHDLPIIGAALTLSGLKLHRDWILEKQRDLELQDFCLPGILSSDWKALADQLKTELRGYEGRLGLHGPFWGFSLASKDPDVRELVARRLHQGLDVCAHLGATQMVIHSPYTTWDFNNLDTNPGARDQVIDLVHQTIGTAARRAGELGCVLVIENIEDKDPHIRVALAQSFASKAVKVSIDTGHANYAHHSTNGPPVDVFVHAAGDMLRLVGIHRELMTAAAR